MAFWANVRTISQEVGYTVRGKGIVRGSKSRTSAITPLMLSSLIIMSVYNKRSRD